MTLMHGNVKKWDAGCLLRVPLFKGPIWERAKRVFSDNPQGGHISLDGL